MSIVPVIVSVSFNELIFDVDLGKQEVRVTF